MTNLNNSKRQKQNHLEHTETSFSSVQNSKMTQNSIVETDILCKVICTDQTAENKLYKKHKKKRKHSKDSYLEYAYKEENNFKPIETSFSSAQNSKEIQNFNVETDTLYKVTANEHDAENKFFKKLKKKRKHSKDSCLELVCEHEKIKKKNNLELTEISFPSNQNSKATQNSSIGTAISYKIPDNDPEVENRFYKKHKKKKNSNSSCLEDAGKEENNLEHSEISLSSVQNSKLTPNSNIGADILFKVTCNNQEVENQFYKKHKKKRKHSKDSYLEDACEEENNLKHIETSFSSVQNSKVTRNSDIITDNLYKVTCNHQEAKNKIHKKLKKKKKHSNNNYLEDADKEENNLEHSETSLSSVQNSKMTPNSNIGTDILFKITCNNQDVENQFYKKHKKKRKHSKDSYLEDAYEKENNLKHTETSFSSVQNSKATQNSDIETDNLYKVTCNDQEAKNKIHKKHKKKRKHSKDSYLKDAEASFSNSYIETDVLNNNEDTENYFSKKSKKKRKQPKENSLEDIDTCHSNSYVLSDTLDSVDHQNKNEKEHLPNISVDIKRVEKKKRLKEINSEKHQYLNVKNFKHNCDIENLSNISILDNEQIDDNSVELECTKKTKHSQRKKSEHYDSILENALNMSLDKTGQTYDLSAVESLQKKKNPIDTLSMSKEKYNVNCILKNSLPNNINSHLNIDDPNYEEILEFELPLLHEKESVAVVNKEQLDEFKARGINVKSGKWSEEEESILRQNFNDYVEKYGMSDPSFLFGIGQERRSKLSNEFVKKTHFYARLGKGLNNRTLRSIYIKSRSMFDSHENKGSANNKEVDYILRKKKTYGNKWTTIGKGLDRSGKNCCSIYRWNEKNINKGKWSEEEVELLKYALEKVAGTTKFADVSKFENISWKKVAELVPSRNYSQCRHYWAEQLNTTMKKRWDKYSFSKLVYFLKYKCQAKDESEINWKEMQKHFQNISPTYCYLQKQWAYLKTRAPSFIKKNYKSILKFWSKYYKDLIQKLKCDLNLKDN